MPHHVVGHQRVGAFLVGVLIKGDDTNPGQIAVIVALVASIIAVKLTAA